MASRSPERYDFVAVQTRRPHCGCTPILLETERRLSSSKKATATDKGSVDPHLSGPAAIRRQKSLSPKRRSLPVTIPHAGCRRSAKDSRTKSITAKTCRRAIATGLAALERPTVRVVAWHSGKVTVAWPEGSRTYEKACRRDPAGLNLGAIAGGGWDRSATQTCSPLFGSNSYHSCGKICRYRLETAGPLLGTQ